MKKILLLSTLIFACLNVCGQENPPVETAQAPLTSISYVPGQTQAETIFAYWQTQQVKILGRGYLALGSGSGLDNVSKAYDKNVELIDVTGVDFEGLQTARFLFHKGVLFGVQSRLKTPFKDKKPQDLNLTADELDALEKTLIKKYGKPNNSQRSLAADGKKPDILSWNLKDNRLIFSANSLAASLILTNPAIEKEIEKNRKNVCKEFNTKEKIICW